MINSLLEFDNAQCVSDTAETERNDYAALGDIAGRRFASYFPVDSGQDGKYSDTTPGESTFMPSLVAFERQNRKNGPVFQLAPTIKTSTFKALQKWEGMVEQVYDDYFSARVIDKTKSSPDEYVEFDIEEIDREDSALIKPGAVFYWSIGYYTSVLGQRFRVSEIRFRRLPAWSASDISASAEKAALLAKHFGLDTEAAS